MSEEVRTILSFERFPRISVQLTAKQNDTVIKYILMLHESLKILEKINTVKFHELQSENKKPIDPIVDTILDFQEMFLPKASRCCINSKIEAKNTWEEIKAYIMYLQQKETVLNCLCDWSKRSQEQNFMKMSLEEFLTEKNMYSQGLRKELETFHEDYQKISLLKEKLQNEQTMLQEIKKLKNQKENIASELNQLIQKQKQSSKRQIKLQQLILQKTNRNNIKMNLEIDKNEEKQEEIELTVQQQKIIGQVDDIVEELPTQLFKEHNSKVITNSQQKYLIKNLQSLLKTSIITVERIYNQHCSTPYQSILQNKVNTVLLIKTKTGRKLAGFSSVSHCETLDTEITRGLLMNISDRKSYPLIQGKSPVLRCTQGISFGSNQIVIKTDKLMITVCPYKAPAFEFDKWEKIFNSNSREISIEQFEIYKIGLKQESKTRKIGKNASRDQFIQKVKMIDEEKQNMRRKIQQLEDFVKKQNEKIRQKRDQCQKYKELYKKACENKQIPQSKALNIEIRKQQNEKNHYQEKILDELNERIEKLEQELASLNEDKNKILKQFKSKEQKLEEMNLMQNYLKKENNDMNEKLVQKEQKLTEFKLKLVASEQNYHKMKTNLQNEIIQNNKSKEQEILLVKNDIQKLKASQNEIEEKLKLKEKKLLERDEIEKQLTQQIQSTKQQLNNKCLQIACLQQNQRILQANYLSAKYNLQTTKENLKTLNSIKGEIVKNQRQLETIRKQKKKIEEEIEDQKQNKNEIQQKIEEVKKYINERHIQYSILIEKQKEQNAKILNNRNDIQLLESHIENKRSEIQSLRGIYEQIQTQSQQLNAQCNWIRRKKGQLETQFQQLNKNFSDENLQEKKNELFQLQKQKSLERSKIEKLKEQCERLKKDQKFLIQQKNIWDNEIKEKKNNLKLSREELFKMQQDIEKQKIRKSDLKRQVQSIQRQIQIIREEFEKQKLKIQQFQQEKMKKTKEAEEYKHLFPGQIFPYYCSEKNYLISEIQRLQHKQVFRTNLIYKYPAFKKTNVHDILDGKTNYVIVIKLENKKIIGAYSQQALAKGVENNKQGFISSLTNKESFYLRRNDPRIKLTAYNEFFLTFGNGQLRIKIDSLKVTSNIGGAIKWFNTGKYQNCQVLFGTQERQVEMEGYEIYELTMKQE